MAKLRWKASFQAEFFRLLADLLASGFSLAQAISSLEKLLPKKPQQLQALANRVALTGSLADSLKPHISENTYHQLMIAEAHGSLDESIAQLGKLLLRRVEQQKHLKALLAYPLVLLFLVIFIMFGVNSVLSPLLEQRSVALEQTFNVWSGLVINSILCLGGLIVVLGLVRLVYWWLKQSTISRHHWYCSIPLVGSLYRTYSYYYISYNLGLLLKSGMSIEQICQFLVAFSPKTLLHQLGKHLQSALEHGEELSVFISRYPFIPSQFSLLLNKGKTPAALAVELLLFSQLMYAKFMRQVERLLGWVQPLLFVVIAIVIVAVYLAILLPLYENMGGLSI